MPGPCAADALGNRAYNHSCENLHQDRRQRDTGLFGGERVSKADPRVAAYGDVDELNAWLGLARASVDVGRAARRRCSSGSSAICSRSARGSRIPRTGSRSAWRRRRSAQEDVARLEAWIDQLEAELPPLRRFILAGGSHAGASLHVARTVCRRAERAIVALGAGRLRAGAAHLRQPPVRSALRHGAARRTIAPARPKPSGESRRPGSGARTHYCERLAREHYENFPVASRLLPARDASAHRRHLRVRAPRR